MQHFLQSKKVPGRLGRVWRVRGIGNTFQRGIERQGHPNQSHSQNFYGDDRAKQCFWKSLEGFLFRGFDLG